MAVTPSSAEILRVHLRCDPSAPRLARQALDGLDAIEPVHDDALLVASELATNVVLQSAPDSGEQIELLAELVHDGLRIAVTGGHRSDRVPRPQVQGSADTGGVGIRVVHALARRWGAERVDGNRVWAVLGI